METYVILFVIRQNLQSWRHHIFHTFLQLSVTHFGNDAGMDSFLKSAVSRIATGEEFNLYRSTNFSTIMYTQ
jgi:hypothetical protein